MADTKISALIAATTPLAGTEVLPIVQSSTTKKVSVDNLTAGKSVSVKDITASSSSTTPFVKAHNLTSALGSIAELDLITSNSFSGISTCAIKNESQNAGNSSADLVFFVNADGGGSAYESARFKGNGGDIKANIGNFVPGTAAKGINFTANTPAAGMTSQLLNWYEEGTWTPDQGSGLTVVGAFSSVGRYTRTGNVVVVNFSFTGATSVAVNAGGNLCTNLPYTSNSSLSYSGVMSRSGLASGGTCAVEGGTKNAWATSTIAATGTLFCSVTYIV